MWNVGNITLKNKY